MVDIDYLVAQPVYKINKMIAEMIALFIDGNKDALLQNTDWFKRMRTNQYDDYIIETIVALNERNCISAAIIVNLRTILGLLNIELKNELIAELLISLDEKIYAMNNLEMVLNQVTYTTDNIIGDILQVTALINFHTLNNIEKAEIITTQIFENKVIASKELDMLEILMQIQDIEEIDIGVIYLELQVLQDDAICTVALEMLEAYHLLSETKKKLIEPTSFIEAMLAEQKLNALAQFDVFSIYKNIIETKMENYEILFLEEVMSNSTILPIDFMEPADAKGQYDLAWKYIKGIDIKKNVSAGIDWLRTAAENGYVYAQYHMALRYAAGDGIEQDEHKAWEWFEKAAAQGHAKSIYKLGKIYTDGIIVEKDYEKAFNCYLQLAQKSNKDAQYKVGIAYMYGNGVEKDSTKAFEWLKKAAERKHKESQHKIGIAYA
ncbi:tetratricopeptide repeat protein, partial [Candidatus Epulonipiscium viviparus]